MRALVWNIRQGGGPRHPRIAQRIQAHDPDLIALIEFIPGTAGPLLQSFRDCGFGHEICTIRNGFEYAVCVLSKTLLTARRSGVPILDDSGLWLEVSIPEHGFSLGVVHAPTSPRLRMKNFLSALAEVATYNANTPFLFAGDLNTGIGPADGPMINFGDVDRFIALQTLGFVDAWRHFHGELREYTWSRAGKSYRIDHAIVSRELLDRVQACRYSHEERTEGVSDHSVLLIDIDR